MDTSGQEESGRRKPDIDLFTLKVNKLFKGNEYQGHSRVQSLPTETKATYKIPKLPPRTNVSSESPFSKNNSDKTSFGTTPMIEWSTSKKRTLIEVLQWDSWKITPEESRARGSRVNLLKALL